MLILIWMDLHCDLMVVLFAFSRGLVSHPLEYDVNRRFKELVDQEDLVVVRFSRARAAKILIGLFPTSLVDIGL